MTLDQFHALVRHPLIAEEPFRTMVIGDICTGLRCSELFALKWSDFDWDNLTLYIQRGVVRGTFDRPKTEPSEALLPLAPEVAEVFWNWKQQTPLHQPDDFVFASPFQGGKAPYSPNRVQTRLREAGLAIGFGDHLGWHTFRHTYRTLLSKARTPVTVQQALMRHADPHQTLKYGEAPTEDQRSASEEVAKLIFDPLNTEETQAQHRELFPFVPSQG